MPINRIYSKASDIPTEIPLFPLSGVILLPHGELPLNIFEPRYLMMIDDALAGNRLIGMIQPNTHSNSTPEMLETVGCTGRITSFQETGDGRYLLGLTGISRFQLLNTERLNKPYIIGQVAYEPFAHDVHETYAEQPGFNSEPLFASLQSFFEIQHLDADWKALRTAPLETVISAMIMVLPLNPAEKQALLECEHFSEQINLFIALTERLVARTQGGHNFSLQ